MHPYPSKDILMPLPDSAAPEQSGLSRRGVIRTAAWSIPAVSVAAAAPAFAASGEQLRVRVLMSRWADVLDEYVRLQLVVDNLSTTTTAGALQLRFTFVPPWIGGSLSRTVNVNATAGGTNWGGTWDRIQTMAYQGGSGAYNATTATTIFALPSLVPNATSGTFDVTINSTNTNIYGDQTPVTITPVVIPAGFTMAADSATQFVGTVG